MKTIIASILILFAYCSLQAEGYSTPESVVYDAQRDVYYISNIGIQGAYDGTILIRKNDETLDELLNDNLKDPKGMCIVGDTLFVVDVNELVVINLTAKRVVSKTVISTPDIFLNDIAADESGYIYLSETAYGRIYRVETNSPEKFQQINFQGTLSSPNGMCFDKDNNRMIIVTFHSKANIMSLDLETMELTLVKATGLDYLDGITRDKSDNWLISSWGTLPMTPGSGKIYKFDKDFVLEPGLFASDFDGPADIFFDIINNVLVVPNAGSNSVQFFQFGNQLDRPILLSPINNSYGLGTNLKIKWQQVVGASTYTVQVSKSLSYNPLVKEEMVSGLELMLSNLDESTTYFWRVKAGGLPNESEWSDSWNFSTAGNSFAPPKLVLPVNGEEYASKKPKFVWNATPAGLYKFELWNNSGLVGVPVAEINNLTDTSVSFSTELPPEQTYYWRVKTFSGYVSSEWSELWSFRVSDFVYPQPELIEPKDNASDISIFPTFVWKSSPAGNYRLQISKYNNFSEMIFDKHSITETTYILTDKLEPLKRYYWRIRAYSGSEGTWSASRSFVTKDPTGVEEQFLDNSTVISPNPASTEIRVSAENQIITSYELYSSTGKLLSSINDLNSSELTINTESLSSGEYFISMMIGNRKLTKRFVIQR